jgi:L-lactate dehydrogenase complex protein LldG
MGVLAAQVAAREEMLARLRRSLQVGSTLPPFEAVTAPPEPPAADRQQMLHEFETQLNILQGRTVRTPRAKLTDCIDGLLRERGVHTLLAWDAAHLPAAQLLQDLQAREFSIVAAQVPSREPARTQHLQSLGTAEAGITGVDGVIAQLGGLVLCGGAGRPRHASLLAPLHIALFTPQQLWPTLAAWLAAQSNAALFADSSSVTVIAGPSRTSDIERVLTLGVHGPKELIAVCIED